MNIKRGLRRIAKVFSVIVTLTLFLSTDYARDMLYLSHTDKETQIVAITITTFYLVVTPFVLYGIYLLIEKICMWIKDGFFKD